MAQKDQKWVKVGLKWKCKVNVCIVAYSAKWLLTKHLKEVHGLVAKKTKLASTSKRGPWHRDHAKMNTHILRDVVFMQKQNDQKVVSCIHAKAQCKWDKLVIVAE